MTNLVEVRSYQNRWPGSDGYTSLLHCPFKRKKQNRIDLTLMTAKQLFSPLMWSALVIFLIHQTAPVINKRTESKHLGEPSSSLFCLCSRPRVRTYLSLKPLLHLNEISLLGFEMWIKFHFKLGSISITKSEEIRVTFPGFGSFPPRLQRWRKLLFPFTDTENKDLTSIWRKDTKN